MRRSPFKKWRDNINDRRPVDNVFQRERCTAFRQVILNLSRLAAPLQATAASKTGLCGHFLNNLRFCSTFVLRFREIGP